jgi:N-acylneuraminate cytidylyltransferase
MPTPDQCVAVIPARGGSKRIPRKNIREFSGQPLIAWPIRMCLESGLFSRVVVSTDDDEIAAIAQSHGAELPFRRPDALADDHASTVAVMAHAVQALREESPQLEFACCVYPACALLGPADLAAALAGLVAEPRADFSAVVSTYSHPIQRALEVHEGRLRPVDPESAAMRTQDLPARWHDDGQFYWGRTEAWLQQRPILANAVPYEVDASRVCDIDTEDDWKRAELLHRMLHED